MEGWWIFTKLTQQNFCQNSTKEPRTEFKVGPQGEEDSGESDSGLVKVRVFPKIRFKIIPGMKKMIRK